MEARAMGDAEAFADGYLTRRGTFQKLFDQHELKRWIDESLGTAPVPAGTGVFYAFRDEAGGFQAKCDRRLVPLRVSRERP
jgi:hypothetical protein